MNGPAVSARVRAVPEWLVRDASHRLDRVVYEGDRKEEDVESQETHSPDRGKRIGHGMVLVDPIVIRRFRDLEVGAGGREGDVTRTEGGAAASQDRDQDGEGQRDRPYCHWAATNSTETRKS